MKKLNEFVSVVISSNEEHRKLMEMTCLVKRQLPVVPVDVPIFNKHDRHIRRNPGDIQGQQLGVVYSIALFRLYTFEFYSIKSVHL